MSSDKKRERKAIKGQRKGEDIFPPWTQTARIVSYPAVTPRKTLKNLSPRDHVALIFSSKEEWEAVVPAFVASGLRRREKCLVIIAVSEADYIRHQIQRQGIDVGTAESAGQLVISPASEVYLRDGFFSPEKTISLLREETERALAEGYSALRVTGEMSWALGQYPSTIKLFEYEARLNQEFFPKYPCIGLCQYDRRKFSSLALKEVILTHPLLAFKTGLRQNFYYFPPEEYFQSRRAELEVDRWLATIEKEHLALEALQESEERFRSLYMNSTVGLYRTTPDGRILLANPTLVKMLGYNSFEELAQRNLEKNGFEPSYPRSLFLEKIEKEGEVHGLESAWKRRDGTYIYVRESARAIRDSEGRTLYYDGTVEDITERKLAEDKLRASLAEKEVLLREVHHRVKNNLQIISSLLRLQSRYIHDQKLLDLIKSTQNRIRSMAMIHERLYLASNFARVDLAAYIEKLVTHLFVVYAVDPSRVSYRIEARGVELDINRAIPCGLIINELVSNALRHAFPHGLSGEILVRLTQDETGCFHLLIKDNGIGLPPEIDPEKAETLGLQIVSILVNQLNGKLRVLREGGTAYSISF